MIRSFHRSIRRWVDEYRTERGDQPLRLAAAREAGPERRRDLADPAVIVEREVGDTTLPDGFDELEPWVAEWARPPRNERYAIRLSKNADQLSEFYDSDPLTAHNVPALVRSTPPNCRGGSPGHGR